MCLDQHCGYADHAHGYYVPCLVTACSQLHQLHEPVCESVAYLRQQRTLSMVSDFSIGKSIFHVCVRHLVL